MEERNDMEERDSKKKYTDGKGRFIKGNPGGGRPKKQPTARDLLKEVAPTLAPQAIEKLSDLINSEDKTIALYASIAILDFCLKYASTDKKNALPFPPTIEEFIQQYGDTSITPPDRQGAHADILGNLGKLGK